jgi:hypothetical protein
MFRMVTMWFSNMQQIRVDNAFLGVFPRMKKSKVRVTQSQSAQKCFCHPEASYCCASVDYSRTENTLSHSHIKTHQSAYEGEHNKEIGL